MTTSRRPHRFAIGVALGLYLCRIFAERSISPTSWGSLALILPVGMGLSFALVTLASRRSIDLTPLLILFAYVLSPWTQLSLATGVGFVAAATCLLANQRDEATRPQGTIADLLVGLLALILYISTLSPTVLPADSGEFQLVSSILGIAHPPGYPLYTMLGHLFTWLPVGDPAYRLNLFAAVTSALAVVVVSRTVRRASGSLWAGIVAAFTLASSATFWAQSTTANIRSMTALFTALCLLTLTSYDRERTQHHLTLFALCFGLGVTHHSSILLLGLPLGATLLASSPDLLVQPKRWVRPLLAFTASFAVLLYLPIRSFIGAPFDPVPIRSLSDFLQHVLALGFRGDMFYFATIEAISARATIALEILRLQFGWGLLSLAGVSLLVLMRRRGKLALLYGGVCLVNLLSALTYRAPQTVEYLIPAYVTLVIIIGHGIAEVLENLRTRNAWTGVLVSLTLLLGGINLARNYPSFAALSDDYSARTYAETILQAAPTDAIILSNWHHATTFWYLQELENLRPDVSVRYVYPEGAAPMAETTIRRVEEELSHRPVIVTNSYHEYDATPYRFAPFHGAYIVYSEPQFALSHDINVLDVDLDDRIRVLGYTLAEGTLSPGDSLTVRVYWQPTVKLHRDYSFFVQVLGPQGVLGQEDITHPAERYRVGEIIVDEYNVPLLLTTPPGEYPLITGVYFTLPEGGWQRLTTKEGNDHLLLPSIHVQPMSVPPVSTHPMCKLFSNGLSLVGADLDHSMPGTQRLYLHWHTPEDLGDDLEVAIYRDGAMLAITRLHCGQGEGYFTTSHDLPPGTGPLSVELHSESANNPLPILGPLNLPTVSRVRLPSWTPEARYVPLGSQMALIRVQSDQPVPVPGQTFRVSPVFLARKPIVHDYRVSLSLNANGGTRHAQHDSVPAMGAIPTLKWLRGWQVTDPHALELPADASGAATLRLTVYDAFTQRPLPVLDDRLVRVGQGLHLDLATFEIEPGQQ